MNNTTKLTPKITLLFEDDTQVKIPVLSSVKGIQRNGRRPVDFYYEPNQPSYDITKEEFMKWFHEVFVHIFDKDSDISQTHLALIDYKG
jgi:hypothetical protein